MIKTLLKLRFRAMFAGLTQQTVKRKKPMSPGLIVLYVLLFVYVIGTSCALMGLAFSSLAPIYHALQLDWLYFAVAGLMALSMSVIGSVFTSQNQLYGAKDNDILLAMPIPPRAILLSRILPLLASNLLFASLIMVPAMVVYAIMVEFSIVGILLQLLALIGICLLAQAIGCALGRLLHLMMRKLSASVSAVIYMVAFLAIYFLIYSKAQEILQAIALTGQQLAGFLETWVWPLFAMGSGSAGNGLHALAFFGICAALFLLVYWFLTLTFLKTATATPRGRKAKKLTNAGADVRPAERAICHKELKKFLNSPVYLTNMGFGLALIPAVPVALIFLKGSLAPILGLLGPDMMPLVVCAFMGLLGATCCISTPSVSLEGKSLWLLKSMPVSGLQVLRGKLRLHLLLTAPIIMVSAFAAAMIMECSPVYALLCSVFAGLFVSLTGLFGMWTGMKWAKFDFLNEVQPCKQSVAVLVSMFGNWAFVILLGLLCWLLMPYLSVLGLMGLCILLVAAGCFGLYRVMVTWGARKWDNLQV